MAITSGRCLPLTVRNRFLCGRAQAQMPRVLTDFELMPDSEVRSATQSTDTQSLPIRSRQALGAGNKIITRKVDTDTTRYWCGLFR